MPELLFTAKKALYSCEFQPVHWDNTLVAATLTDDLSVVTYKGHFLEGATWMGQKPTILEGEGGPEATVTYAGQLACYIMFNLSRRNQATQLALFEVNGECPVTMAEVPTNRLRIATLNTEYVPLADDVHALKTVFHLAGTTQGGPRSDVVVPGR